MRRFCRLSALALAIAALDDSAFAQDIEVAITVDDLSRTGPETMGWPRPLIAQTLINAFVAHQVPGVYGFVNSRRVINNNDQQILQSWLNAGYPLGNHTARHLDMSVVGVPAFLQDIDETEQLLESMMGPSQARAYKIFRFPFSQEGTNLGTKAQLRAHLAARDYRLAHLTIDIFDWAFNDAFARCIAQNNQAALTALRDQYINTAMTSFDWSVAASQAFFGRQIKHVLLMHVGSMSADMIERLLTEFENRGVRFITVDEALKDPLYSIPITRPSGSFLQQYRQVNPTLYAIPHPGAPSTANICP